MKTLILIALVALSFSACGGGGGADSLASNPSNFSSDSSLPTTNKSANEDGIILMRKNTPYTLSKGDKIVKVSQNARVKIKTNITTKTTTATLISGEAEIH